MENLYDLGYDMGQVNQIVKLQSVGVDILPYINPTVNVEKLRKIYSIFSKTTYNKKNTKTIIKYIFTKDVDVTPYINDGYCLCSQLNIIVDMLKQGYSTDMFEEKGYDYTEMKEIYKYLKKGVNISKYIDMGIPAETGFILESNGIGYEKITETFDKLRISYICQWLKQGIDVSKYIKPNYTSSQINAVADAIRDGVDVSIVTKGDLAGSIMSSIRTGLVKGFDITPYLKPEHDVHFADTILLYMEAGIDPTLAVKYTDYKYAKLAKKLLEKGIDASFINEDICYDITRFFVRIKEKSVDNPDIDFDLIFAHPTYPINQLTYAVNIMEAGFDASAILEKSISSTTTLCEISDAIFNGIALKGYIANTRTNIEIHSLIVLLQAGYEIKPREE